MIANRLPYKIINRRGGNSSSVASTRRTAESVTLSIGQLTKAGYGGVSYSNIPDLLVDDSVAVTSWTATQLTGADHWTLAPAAGITPVPKAAGVTAGLPTDYTFEVEVLFADAETETVTLTIETVANTFTISSRDTLAAFKTAAGGDAGISGKRVEIATGSDLSATTWNFADWRPAGGCTITYADVSRPSPAKSFEFRGSHNLTIDDLEVNSVVGSNAKFYIARSTSGDLSPATNIIMNRPKMRGSRAVIDALNGASAAGWNAIRMAGCAGLTINDADIEWCYNGFTQDVGLVSTGVVINSPVVRNFFDNVFILGSSAGASDITINDAVAIGAWRAVNNTTHIDYLQISDAALNTTVNVNRYIAIHGEGDAYEQPHQDGGAKTAGNGTTLIVDGWVYVGRSNQMFKMSNAHNTNIKRVTAWKCNSGEVSTASTENDGYQNTGPSINMIDGPGAPAGTFSGTNVISRTILYDDVAGARISEFTYTDGVFQHNGLGASPPINTGFQFSNPKTSLEGLDYTQSSAAIVSAVKAVLSPSVGGAYKRADGSYNGALNPDGSWATDTAF